MSFTSMLPGFAALLAAVGALFAGINGFSLVHEGEEGLLKRFGRVKRNKDGTPKVLKSGFRLLIPWAYVVIKRSVKLQTNSLSQQFVTKDGLVYTIIAVINFKICDIYKALIDVTNLDEYMKAVGYLIIHEEVTKATTGDNENLIPDVGATNKQIEEEIKTRAAEWGIEIVDFKITSFAPSAHAQQVLAIPARERSAEKALIEFFGSKEEAYKNPQIAAVLIGAPVSTTVS